MTWDSLYAGRTALVRPNRVREFLKLTRQPGIISFAGGLPAPELLPLNEVQAAAPEVCLAGPSCLQYGESEGVPELRDRIAAMHPGMRRENVLITAGAQQGLDLLGRLFLEPRDLVAVEDPTYLALLGAWRPHGVRFEPLRFDEEGAMAEAAVQLLERRPKLAYVVPNFQNPTGKTLPLEGRLALLGMARRSGVPLVEDDPYGALRYDGEAIPAILDLARERGWEGVIRVGTFSKVFAPGLRIGWVIGAAEVIEKLTHLKQAADLHASTFTQHLTLRLLEGAVFDRQVERLRLEYRRRRDVMLAAMERWFPKGSSWSRPAGGMFVLARLPELDAAELLPEALRAGVAFVPGAEFHLEGGEDTMRLNFSHPQPEQIEKGIRRLGEVMASRLGRRREDLG